MPDLLSSNGVIKLQIPQFDMCSAGSVIYELALGTHTINNLKTIKLDINNLHMLSCYTNAQGVMS